MMWLNPKRDDAHQCCLDVRQARDERGEIAEVDQAEELLDRARVGLQRLSPTFLVCNGLYFAIAEVEREVVYASLHKTMMAASADDPPPPPYKKVAPLQPRATPEITILLLGSPGVGKTTFLKALPRVRDGRLHKELLTVSAYTPNPSSFSVTLFNRPYNIVIHRSESTLFVDPFPSKVDFVIFCYAIDSRESLYNCQFYWRKQFAERYERERGLVVPVMLVGLKRDLRTDKMEPVEGTTNVVSMGGQEVGAGAGARGGSNGVISDKREQYVCVIPQEGLKAAQEMRCDRYAECSALTGDLMWEVLEDITRTAALTTTSHGGLSTPKDCVLM